MRQPYQQHTMNIDDSTRIQTFFRQKTHFGVGKLLTISRGYKDRARERTSVYQEGAVLPLTFNCILRNNGTFHRFKKCHDEWIGEHSKLFELGLLSLNVVFRKFFYPKRLWCALGSSAYGNQTSVRPKTDAVRRNCRRNTDYSWSDIFACITAWNAQAFQSNSLRWVAFFAIIKQIKCGWLHREHVKFTQLLSIQDFHFSFFLHSLMPWIVVCKLQHGERQFSYLNCKPNSILIDENQWKPKHRSLNATTTTNTMIYIYCYFWFFFSLSLFSGAC